MKFKYLVLGLALILIFSMQAISAVDIDDNVLNQTDQISLDSVDVDVLKTDAGQDMLSEDDEIPWSTDNVVRVYGGNFFELNKAIYNY